MIMERKIGEIFEHNGEWYQCVEGLYCYDCAFVDDNCEDRERITLREKLTKQPVTGFCNSEKRKDGKDVIFKKLEKVGESYTTFVDKTVQNYLLETAVSVPPKDVFVLINNEQRLIAIEIKQNKEDMEERELDPHMAKVIDEATQKMGEEIGRQIEANINKQRMKPFSLELAKAGKPVCTRDGRKARIICFDRVTNSTNEYTGHLIVLVTNPNGDEQSFYYTEKGNLAGEDEYDNHKWDLMMLPQKKEGWVNVYMEETNNNERLIEQVIYKTRKDAFDNACPRGYKATVKIEWEE